MPYWQVKGRRPFERASKIAHAEIINNPLVQHFVQGCTLPSAPPPEDLKQKLLELPEANGRISAVIAIDGGMTETYVREEFPTASIAFIAVGPLLLRLEDLADLDRQPFIGPEDMQRLKSIERYVLVLPTKSVRAKGGTTFSQGVRWAVQDFLLQRHLMPALQWLLFREWRAKEEREAWEIPKCPNPDCWEEQIRFRSGDSVEQPCPRCRQPVYLSDGLRLYERIDEELGAGAILGYLLTAIEQIVLVHLIRSIWNLKPSLFREVLFIKDGPLAFFGVTAPMYRPMRDLMKFLGTAESEPLINLVGVEKTGPFVEHAALIDKDLGPGQVLVLNNEYIYRHIEPGNASDKSFGKNTYYGAKVIFRGWNQDTYVASIPTGDYKPNPALADFYNGADVLRVLSRLRCSMYDNALVPVVLANRLVSLADVPSAEILKKFAKQQVKLA
ncbi:MAG: hypothetical protein DMD33_18215 [Gemmatimonadetes bacterium]|nr:MAG: hypothetical protein DMD33_18215 [Gemmatimonadota bacterium]